MDIIPKANSFRPLPAESNYGDFRLDDPASRGCDGFGKHLNYCRGLAHHASFVDITVQEIDLPRGLGLFLCFLFFIWRLYW